LTVLFDAIATVLRRRRGFLQSAIDVVELVGATTWLVWAVGQGLRIGRLSAAAIRIALARGPSVRRCRTAAFASRHWRGNGGVIVPGRRCWHPRRLRLLSCSPMIFSAVVLCLRCASAFRWREPCFDGIGGRYGFGF